MNNYKTLVKKVEKYLKENVSKSRYEHSLRTAKMAKKLCKLYNQDQEKGYFVGIAHDICKQESEEVLFSLAQKDGDGFSELEKNKPSLLHGRAASIKLKEFFEVTDSDIIEAVKNHTFGKEGMCDLAKILFVADKIEPGREHISSSYVKKLLRNDLNQVVKNILIDNIEYLEKKGKKIANETYLFLKSL